MKDPSCKISDVSALPGLIMFSGFTNQMSSISSWIGAKKAGGPSEESSPQNPEDEPVVTEAAATSPGSF